MSYFNNITIKGKNFDDVIELVKSELAKEGSGVPAEIDMQQTFKMKLDVDFVGLSSLMTTTLNEMEYIINILKKKQYQGAVIIGGAVTSQEYANNIGADLYAKDALDGVKKANAYIKN